MDGFEFENCGNAVLKCEGKILGGVEKATCTRKNSFKVLNLTLQRRKSFTRIAKCLNFQALLRAAEVFLQP